MTRPLADLTLDGAPGRPVATGEAAGQAVAAGAGRRGRDARLRAARAWPSGAWT